MKYPKGLYLFLLLCFASCGKGGDAALEKEGSGLGELVMLIQKQDRFYSTEYHVHKIITHNDTKQLQGSIFSQEFNIALPFGKRSVAIPIEATVKAYIDFSAFSESNVRRSDDRIEIILPDPQLEITSTRINHEEVKEYIPLLRGHFSDEELSLLEHIGRDAIARDLPGLNFIETARRNAANALIPLIADMGYDRSSITITFRKEFSVEEILKRRNEEN